MGVPCCVVLGDGDVVRARAVIVTITRPCPTEREINLTIKSCKIDIQCYNSISLLI